MIPGPIKFLFWEPGAIRCGLYKGTPFLPSDSYVMISTDFYFWFVIKPLDRGTIKGTSKLSEKTIITFKHIFKDKERILK